MIDIESIRDARHRIAGHILHTPVVHCRAIDRDLGGEVYFKCENLQAAGAFKARGACNAVFSLPAQDARRGVATHSSGNHAAALARAAARRGIPAHIVMPRTARAKKVEAVRRYGGQITFCEPTLAAREESATRVVEQTGATLIHPYDDDRVIAGQATAVWELIEQQPNLDIVVAPVGGGGLLSGTAVCAKSLRAEIRVWGAEPRGADDAYRSWKSGRRIPAENPQTIADGLLTSLGERNFEIIRRLVDDILLAGDETIVRAVRRLREETEMIVEPSGAVALAALCENRPDLLGKRVGVILSGGNVDWDDFVAQSQL
jgi:threonine dehydratase